MFELLIIEPLPGLEELGAQVQLREQPAGIVIEAMERGQAIGSHRGIDAVLAVSLFVDGEPIGTLEALDGLPGRFVSGLIDARGRCVDLYRFTVRSTPPAASNDSDANDAQAGATTPGEA